MLNLTPNSSRPAYRYSSPDRIQLLHRTAKRWDRDVRRELHVLAQKHWPDASLCKYIHIHRYRLRKQLESGSIVWWVEKDTSPSDLYLCAAYRVELSISSAGNPELIVRSGDSVHPVKPLRVSALKSALQAAGSEIPLLVHRQFGDALDP